MVLKDIWGLDGAQARDVALWSAHALVRAAVAEAGETAGRVDGRQADCQDTGNQSRRASAAPRKAAPQGVQQGGIEMMQSDD